LPSARAIKRRKKRGKGKKGRRTFQRADKAFDPCRAGLKRRMGPYPLLRSRGAPDVFAHPAEKRGEDGSYLWGLTGIKASRACSQGKRGRGGKKKEKGGELLSIITALLERARNVGKWQRGEEITLIYHSNAKK